MAMDDVPPWETEEQDDEVPPWETPDPRASEPNYAEGEAAKLFPSAIALDREYQESGKTPNPLRSGLAVLTDAMDAPTRWASTFRGMEMSDPNAYVWRPEVEQVQESIDDATSPYGRGAAGAGVVKTGLEIAGRFASDPMLGLGVLGQGIKAVGKGIPRVGSKVAGTLKKGLSDLSQIPEELLDRASSKEGMVELSDAARRTSGGNMLPEAQDLAQKVQAVNEGRIAAKAEEEARQLTDFEKELSQSLRRPGVLTGTPSRGADIPEVIAGAKGPMQEAYLAGDKAAVGPLRGKPSTAEVRQIRTPVMGKPAPGTSTPVQVGEEVSEVRVRDVSKGIKQVLSEFKALRAEQGVPKITRGAAGALKGILGMAENQASTVDDLINLKGQLRSVRAGGSFEGNVFDASVDDLAFAKAEEVINRSVEKAIAKADPQNAGKIIALMRANNQQYAKTKELLSGLSNSMGRVENSDRVISKVAALGPKKSRELIESAQSIPALRPVVDELRQGFMDDLILSASKGGKIDPAAFARRWNDKRTLSPELKSAWLRPEQIARIDDAVKMSALEIGKPDLIGGKLFGAAKDPLASASLGARRMENIGTMANRDAARELEFIDDILGLEGKERFSEQAKDVFQARQLGMDANGKLPLTPMSQTGRSILGFGWGDTIGGILGGTLGFAAGGLLGAGAGATIGAGTRTAARAGVAFMQSPAGAVAANRVLKRWATEQAAEISPRAGAIAKALEKTQSPAIKARLLNELRREMEKKGEEK